jgi:hypothetical protein
VHTVGTANYSGISELIQRVGYRGCNLSSFGSKVFIELIFSTRKEKMCYTHPSEECYVELDVRYKHDEF